MSRKMTGVLCVSFAIAALGLLNAKYQAKELKSELDSVRKDLTKERERIHILEAEWAYLNRPENLSLLAHQHLPDLGPVQPSQVISFHTMDSVNISETLPP